MVTLLSWDLSTMTGPMLLQIPKNKKEKDDSTLATSISLPRIDMNDMSSSVTFFKGKSWRYLVNQLLNTRSFVWHFELFQVENIDHNLLTCCSVWYSVTCDKNNVISMDWHISDEHHTLSLNLQMTACSRKGLLSRPGILFYIPEVGLSLLYISTPHLFYSSK